MAGYRDYLKALGFEPDVPMASKVSAWRGWYNADCDWYSSTEYSADGRTTYKVERISIKPARMVCQEWVSLILNERTQVATDDDAVNKWLAAWLTEHFFPKAQRLVERAFALGTGAWALSVEGYTPASVSSPGARIRVRSFDAQEIIPLSFDDDDCTECAFVSQVTHRGRTYDQLQMHLLDDASRYTIRTVFFDERGKEVTLPGVATDFATRSATPLFALVCPGLDNPYWEHSPFGVSVFDDALGAVKITDTAADNLQRDIWLGQKMLFLDERMLTTDTAGNIVVPRAQDQQLFRKSEMDGASKLIEEYNPDLRVTDNREAIKTGLELLGMRTGLGGDYFGLEGVSGVKTATEVVAEDSDLYRNLRKHENAIAPAIQAIAAGVLSLARTVLGVALPEDVGEMRVLFDDSVIEDTNAQRERDRKDVASGLMQPWEYRVKWYGEDEATARAMTGGDELPPEE